MRDRQAGVAPLELALGFALLLVPMALVVLSFAPLLEARASARSGAIAAARTIVLTGDEEIALSEAARTLARNGHERVVVSLCGGPPGPIAEPASTCLDADGLLARGQVVSVELAVRIDVLPAIGLPMRVEASHEHAELVDLYRSIPRP